MRPYEKRVIIQVTKLRRACKQAPVVPASFVYFLRILCASQKMEKAKGGDRPDQGDGVKESLVANSRLGKGLEKRTCIIVTGFKKDNGGTTGP